MSDIERESRRIAFLGEITAGGRSRIEGVKFAARMLHKSPHTVVSWLKPETCKSSKPIPQDALELWAYKKADPQLAAEFTSAPSS